MSEWVTDSASVQGTQKPQKQQKQQRCATPYMGMPAPPRCMSALGLPPYGSMSELIYHHVGNPDFTAKLALLPVYEQRHPTDPDLNILLGNMLFLERDRRDLLQTLHPMDDQERLRPWIRAVAARSVRFVFWHCTSGHGAHAGNPLGDYDDRCSQCVSTQTHTVSEIRATIDVWVGHTPDGARTYTVACVPADEEIGTL